VTEADRYPRVLVVGQAFDRSTGGGITLSNLFEGWPRDRLANVVPPAVPIARDVCDRFYSLGTSEIGWVWPLSLVRRTDTPPSGALERSAVASSQALAGGAARDTHGVARELLRASVGALGALDVLRSMRPSKALLEWIRGFGPDVIYSQLGDLPIIELVRGLVAETGSPFALHVMDDWPESKYREGALAPLARARMRRGLHALVEDAGVLLAISERMASEYAERYGRPFTAVHNPVDLDRWDADAAAHPRSREAEGEGTLVLVYAGRIGNANVSSLRDVAEAVGRLSSSGEPLQLHVYTNDIGAPAVAALAACPGVIVRPGVEYAQVPGLLAASDALLLPLDFDERALRFARLSMPTKVSEYLAAGRPVLTYAPRESAVAQYAREGAWSLVVDERDPSLVEGALRRLLSEPALRTAMGAHGRRLAAERHDAGRVRARFAEELAKAGRSGRGGSANGAI